ncbi:MAG TPA: DUF58 domain-containing protein [Flavobacterium sp.]|nr:DUF58 domain-containing protein [Flavobacterium sp.]
MKNLYTTNLFYYCIGTIAVLFVLSFFFAWLYPVVWVIVGLFLVVCLVDIFLLFGHKKGIVARRELGDKLSNGDENFVQIQVESSYKFKTNITIIDEIPFQFQRRDFSIQFQLNPQSTTEKIYSVRPTERGVYTFGFLNIYVSTKLDLFRKRYRFDNQKEVPTYPSFIQMRKYELLAIHNKLHLHGLKKIRRIGHTTEFEHIKEYVFGDDIRTINWKATAKRNQLMVNQYQDEKSQNVYLIIDKGRVMKMPFSGLTLLDYAINASLAMGNVVIKKADKAGLFTFSKKVDTKLKADRKPVQIQRFMESLYQVKTDFKESDYERLLVQTKQHIRQRSLIILFTNFETLDGLNRQLPYLRSIAKLHLLTVVFFKNSELDELVHSKPKNTQQIYDKVIAEKLNNDKELIVRELRKYGIYSVLTRPENLTIDVINKYLEFKARGLL